MNNLIELKSDGHYWPKFDTTMIQYLSENDRLNEPFKVSQYCKNKRLCLQAGGNVGIYPMLFSKIFDNVITFEPEPLNFECMNLNIQNYNIKNITSYQALLGNENRKVALQICSNNCGAHNVGKEIEEGNISMLKIDDLNLQNLDLIVLDVEGFEIEVLKGGINTIKKYWPVICAEIGWSNCTGLLQNLGYSKISTIDGNGIFLKNE